MKNLHAVIWRVRVATQGRGVASDLIRSRREPRIVTRPKRRARTSSISAAILLSGIVSVAVAHTVHIAAPNTPSAANHRGTVIDVSRGSASLNGTIRYTNAPGTTFVNYSLLDAYNRGFLSMPVNPNGRMTLTTGSPNHGVLVPDAITNGTTVVKTYANAAISENRPGGTRIVTVYSPTPAGALPFIDAPIANVSGGATFDMNAGGTVGDRTIRNTTFVNVMNGTANWNAANTIQFAQARFAVDPSQVQPYSDTVNLTTYAGTFTVTTRDGAQTKTVTNLSELRAYNTWLIGQLQAGKLPASPTVQAAYDRAFAQAFTNTAHTYQATPYTAPILPGDPMFVPYGTQIGMLANGQNAVGRVTPTGDVRSWWYSNGGTLLAATGGGTIVNDGTVSNARFVTGIAASSGGRVINGGVRNVGDIGFGEIAEVQSDSASGAGTTYVNDGTVNLSVWNSGPNGSSNSTWLTVGSGALGTNRGAANIGTNPTTAAGRAIGVQVDDGGTFRNDAGGVIYLGRGASTDTASAPLARGGADVAQPNGAIGINVGSGGSARNDGTIVVGDRVQNGYAIQATGTGVDVVNAGSIDVKGHYNGSPLANAAIHTTATSGTVGNTGAIALVGINGIGIRALWGGQAFSNGIIDVVGGADRASGLRNFGLWSEGGGSNVKLTGGAVNLSGDGAIGVHARNGGRIVVNGGAVNFVSGTGQTGFFAFGAGSSVSIDQNSAAGLDVGTAGSTLFRIENGATIINPSSTPLTASGAGTTAINVTGSGSNALFDGARIIVSGIGATALKVEGGAAGRMSGTSNLTLHDRTTAIVVDNLKYDLAGNVVGTAPSRFTNTASIDVGDARDVTAFVVKNGATLVNAGDIHLSHGTAIELTGAGSTVVPGPNGKYGRLTVDNGGAGIHVHGGATLNSSGTIGVGGTATGIMVGADAGRVIVGRHAAITGTGSASGTLITNQATAGQTLIDGATLDMRGSGAALLTTNDLDPASHAHVIVSSLTSGKGIALSNADGSRTSGSLTLGPKWRVDVTGNGSGIHANTAGDLTLDRAQLTVSGTHGATGIRTDAATQLTIGAGSLLQATTPDATLITGNPSTLTNAGTLDASSTATQAIALDDGGHAFVNTATGKIRGGVALGNGTNTALLASGSTLDGTLSGGTGDDTFTVQDTAAFTAVDGGPNGNDTLVFDGARYTHDNERAIRRFDTVRLSNNSTLTLERALTSADDGTDNGTIAIDADSTLAVSGAPSSDFVLNNALQGAGTVRTDTGGYAFDFGTARTTATATGFTGTLALGNSRFALNGGNAAALTRATLQIDAGSVTTVDDGRRKIGGLTFNGGTISFDAKTPDQTVAGAAIAVEQLDARGTGAVRVHVPTSYVTSAPDTPNAANLLMQDDASIGIQLVHAGAMAGSGGALIVQDRNGDVISASRGVDIEQDGRMVAKGTYDFRLTTAPGDGLYVNYGLKRLDLLAGRTLTLSQDTDAANAAADMSARIGGAGNLTIDARAGTISVSNTTNDYTGNTTVASGTLRVDADNALGHTDTLLIAGGAGVHLSGQTQTINVLDARAGSTLDIGGGTLNVTNGGTSRGALAGAGTLNVLDRALDVHGANSALTADTMIARRTRVRLDDAAGLGSGGITNHGELTLDGAAGTLTNALRGDGGVMLINGANVTASGDSRAFSGRFSIAADTALTVADANHLGTAAVDNAGTLTVDNSTDWTLTNAVTGTGDLVKNGSGALRAGRVAHTGTTDVKAGTLIVGDAHQPDATLGGNDAGRVTIARHATLAGFGTVNGQIVNHGTVGALNAVAVQDGGAAGTFTLAGGLVNHGTINLAGVNVGNTLTVVGDYAGKQGNVVMHTVLAGDASPTDKLVIDGGRASGSTALVIRNAGGSGAPTVRGIRVVETVNGAVTDPGAFDLSAASDGYRQRIGTIAAGAYDYGLVRGGASGQSQDWYLVSRESACQPSMPGCPVDADRSAPDSPAPAPRYRPEVGAYLHNKLAASTLLFHTLSDRRNPVPGTIGQMAETSADQNSWARVAGKVSGRHGALDTTDASYLLHAGVDVARFSDWADGRIRVGLMAAYGSDSSRSSNGALSSRGNVRGYAMGAYGTWSRNRSPFAAPYLDAWAMYGAFSNEVAGQGLPAERYRSTGVVASLEVGYPIPIYRTANAEIHIEPQGQVIVSRYRAGNHTEQNGTVVSGQSDTHATTRAGVRVNGAVLGSAGAARMRPFAELNWWHGPASQTLAFDNVSVRDDLPAHRFESKFGLRGNVTDTLSASGFVGLEVGTHGYRAGRAQVAMKYAW